MNWWKLVAVVVILLLVVLVVWFWAVPTIYTWGANDGLQTAVVQIMQASTSCQPVPLTFGNTTMQLINVECLQNG